MEEYKTGIERIRETYRKNAEWANWTGDYANEAQIIVETIEMVLNELGIEIGGINK